MEKSNFQEKSNFHEKLGSAARSPVYTNKRNPFRKILSISNGQWRIQEKGKFLVLMKNHKEGPLGF